MMSFWVVPASWCAATSSGSSRRRAVLLLGDDLVHREQPHRGGVDRHRGVHLGERDVLEEPAHLAEVRHRHADLADLAAAQRRVGVVAGLRRQVEGDRQAGLALGQVGPVERVGRRGRRVAGVRPHHPRPVLRGRAASGRPTGPGPRVSHGVKVGPRLPASHRLECEQPHPRRQAEAAARSTSTTRASRVRCSIRRTAGPQLRTVRWWPSSRPGGWRRRAPGAR